MSKPLTSGAAGRPTFDPTQRVPDTVGEKTTPRWPAYVLAKDEEVDPRGDLYFGRGQSGEVLSAPSEQGLADIVDARDNPLGGR